MAPVLPASEQRFDFSTFNVKLTPAGRLIVSFGDLKVFHDISVADIVSVRVAPSVVQGYYCKIRYRDKGKERNVPRLATRDRTMFAFMASLKPMLPPGLRSKTRSPPICAI